MKFALKIPLKIKTTHLFHYYIGSWPVCSDIDEQVSTSKASTLLEQMQGEPRDTLAVGFIRYVVK